MNTFSVELPHVTLAELLNYLYKITIQLEFRNECMNLICLNQKYPTEYLNKLYLGSVN